MRGSQQLSSEAGDNGSQQLQDSADALTGSGGGAVPMNSAVLDRSPPATTQPISTHPPSTETSTEVIRSDEEADLKDLSDQDRTAHNNWDEVASTGTAVQQWRFVK